MADLSPVALLWVTNWWDGPVEGMASFGGRDYWFKAVFDAEADEWTQPRRCRLYELDDDERVRLWARHRRWEELAGGNWCFHDGAPEPALRPGWQTFDRDDDPAVRTGREIGEFVTSTSRAPHR